MKLSIVLIAGTLATVFALNELGPPGRERTILEVVAQDPQFSTLAGALKATGLDEMLAQEGPLTVFAPTDAAFAKLSRLERDALLKNRLELAEVLRYHLVPGRITAAQARGLGRARTVEGSDLEVRVQRGRVRVDDALVVRADLTARNGVIHAIDEVLVPR